MPKNANEFNPELLKRVRHTNKMTQGEAAASIGISKRSLAGFETGERVPTGATLALIEKWINQAADDDCQGRGVSPDQSGLQARYDDLKERLRLEYQERLRWLDRIDELEAETRRLKDQLRTSGLGPEEMANVEDIHRALGLSGPVDVSQVLHAAATSFRAVTSQSPTISPPSDDEQDSKLKREGGQGGKAVKRRRATS